jgi:hypothetical protein
VLYTEVQAFKATAPTAANLLASALLPASTDDNWMEGLSFRGELCPSLQVFGPCSEPDLPDGDFSQPVYYRPAGYRVMDTCSTLERGFDPARVTRLAEAVASYAVASELWTGAGTQAEPYDIPARNGQTMNGYLADDNAEVITETPENLLDALGLLEQTARERTRGQQVFLHVPIRVVNRVGAQLRRVGNEIKTHTDATVIADAGYTGAGPLDTGTSEVQTVTITGGPTGGTFTTTYNGQTTAGVAFNATAAVYRTALEALSNIAPGDIAVTGANGGPYTVTFLTPGNVPQMTASGAGLTGGTAPAANVATGTPGVARATLPGLWMYATGPVEVRLGQVVTTAEQAVTVDRRTNSRQVWADRMFAAAFDPCCQFAMQIPEAT